MKALKTVMIALALTALSVPALAQDMTNEDWLNKGFTVGIGAGPGIGSTFGLTCPDGATCPTGQPTGLSVRVFPIETFGVELVFGMNVTSLSREVSPSQFNQFGEAKSVNRLRELSIAILPEFRFLTSNRAALSGYAGIGITNTKIRTDLPSPFQPGGQTVLTEVTDSVTSIGFEFGLRGEVFLYKYFSIFGRVGISIDPASDAEQEGFVDLQVPATSQDELTARAQEEALRDTVDLGGAHVSVFDSANLLGHFGFSVWFN